MNKKQKIIRLLGTMLIACLMAGAVSSTVVEALGLGAHALGAYAGALALAALSALCAYSAVSAVIGVAGGTVALGAWIATGLSEGGQARALLDALRAANDGGADALAGSAGLLAGALAGLFAVIFFVLLTERGALSTMFATSVTLGVTVVCAALSERVWLVQLVPAIVGACAAIAHSAEQRRTGGHLKALIPALIAVGLAFALVPGSGFTLKPLEDAATKIKQLYEDYFNYTQERVAFTISERGYDYYGLRDDQPTHMLGGPANPTTDAVMLVTTDDDLLLRGTVRGTYTGYSWEDTTAKARNLYYDFTRLSRRDSVFGTSLLEELDGGYSPVRARVRMLADGSSTLFVPGRLTDFDMTLKNAVYYNTVGELFLARSVEKGDEYAFAAEEVTDYAALAAAAARAGADEGFEDAARLYTRLPEGIESGVYRIADALTEGRETPAEKAQAILEGLKANCKYNTDVPYPPQNRDFVSYFLTDSREGYCSYFATAMAVLCRIEGIPARYVEGYRVYAEPDGVTTVTGESAHAWVEVYFSGVGWVAYDPTPGRDDAPEDGNANAPDHTPEPTPTAEPSPEPTEDASANVEQPTPSPNPDDQPTTEPTSDPTMSPTENPHTLPDERQKSGRWLRIILIALLLLILIALLYLWIKSRLEKTDPVRLAARQSDQDKAILILYRALLTLLSQLGQAPLSGETPEAFALRVCRGGMANPDFEAFAKGVTVARYSRARATRELTALGSRAYVRFRQQMKRGERVRFDLYRVLHGLGDISVIP